MGVGGFLYRSVKDNLKWRGLRPKNWAWLVMRVGEALALDEEEYQKQKTKKMRMENSDMATVLKAAFGVDNG